MSFYGWPAPPVAAPSMQPPPHPHHGNPHMHHHHHHHNHNPHMHHHNLHHPPQVSAGPPMIQPVPNNYSEMKPVSAAVALAVRVLYSALEDHVEKAPSLTTEALALCDKTQGLVLKAAWIHISGRVEKAERALQKSASIEGDVCEPLFRDMEQKLARVMPVAATNQELVTRLVKAKHELSWDSDLISFQPASEPVTNPWVPDLYTKPYFSAPIEKGES